MNSARARILIAGQFPGRAAWYLRWADLWLRAGCLSAQRPESPSHRRSRVVRRRVRAQEADTLYHLRVGARAIDRRSDSAVRRKERLTFWVIIAVIGLPMILAYALVALDMRTDLSELKPRVKGGDGTVLLGWADLKESDESPRRVRMLGYMMDDLRRPRGGSSADTFILLPEAGQFLHPAHRTPDQMVVVWPRYPAVFRNRQLVWAAGTLSRAPRTSDTGQPAYAMTFADISPADERDIGKWFHP